MDVDASKLKRLRLSRFLTQVELAERAGITEAAYNRIENNHNGARVSTVRKLADALGVDPAELVDLYALPPAPRDRRAWHRERSGTIDPDSTA
jgi:transcriptional regulator with XRE-family HTH domain